MAKMDAHLVDTVTDLEAKYAELMIKERQKIKEELAAQYTARLVPPAVDMKI